MQNFYVLALSTKSKVSSDTPMICGRYDEVHLSRNTVIGIGSRNCYPEKDLYRTTSLTGGDLDGVLKNESRLTGSCFAFAATATYFNEVGAHHTLQVVWHVVVTARLPALSMPTNTYFLTRSFRLSFSRSGRNIQHNGAHRYA